MSSSPQNRRGSLLKSSSDNRKLHERDEPRGVLEKLSSGMMRKKWQQRYFAYSAADRCLRYWPAKNATGSPSKGCVALSADIMILTVASRVIHLVEEGSGRVTKLRCKDKTEAERWIAAFEGATNRRRQKSDAPEYMQEALLASQSSPQQPASPPAPISVSDRRSRPPDVIDAEQGRRMRNELIDGVDGRKVVAHFPWIATSYATSHRDVDAEGCGPGMWLNHRVCMHMKRNGCTMPMTGMLFATGNWQAYMLRLDKDECEMMRKPHIKVLIVLWTKALFSSRPCMGEIESALKNTAQIIVLRCEDVNVPKKEQWPLSEKEQTEADPTILQAHMLNRKPVVDFLATQNTIPTPGNTILTLPSTLDDLMKLPCISENLAAVAASVPPVSVSTSSPSASPSASFAEAKVLHAEPSMQNFVCELDKLQAVERPGAFLVPLRTMLSTVESHDPQLLHELTVARAAPTDEFDGMNAYELVLKAERMGNNNERIIAERILHLLPVLRVHSATAQAEKATYDRYSSLNYEMVNGYYRRAARGPGATVVPQEASVQQYNYDGVRHLIYTDNYDGGCTIRQSANRRYTDSEVRIWREDESYADDFNVADYVKLEGNILLCTYGNFGGSGFEQRCRKWFFNRHDEDDDYLSSTLFENRSYNPSNTETRTPRVSPRTPPTHGWVLGGYLWSRSQTWVGGAPVVEYLCDRSMLEAREARKQVVRSTSREELESVCFEGAGMVLLADGSTRKRVDQIRVGERVWVPTVGPASIRHSTADTATQPITITGCKSAKVVLITQQLWQPPPCSACGLCQLPTQRSCTNNSPGDYAGLLVTPEHPVLLPVIDTPRPGELPSRGGDDAGEQLPLPAITTFQWYLPRDIQMDNAGNENISHLTASKDRFVYNFELDSGHIVDVNGALLVTLGHNFVINEFDSSFGYGWYASPMRRSLLQKPCKVK